MAIPGFSESDIHKGQTYRLINTEGERFTWEVLHLGKPQRHMMTVIRRPNGTVREVTISSFVRVMRMYGIEE